MENDYIPVKLNADKSSAIASAYQISRVPTEVVLSPQGNIIQKLSCPLEPNAYGAQLVNVAQHYRGNAANRTVSAQMPVNSAYAGLKITPPARPQAVATVRPASTAPVQPVVTQNPYAIAARPAASQVAAAPVVQQRATGPALPANAMPNSYRGRYTAAPAPAPVVAAQQPPITPTAITPPVVAATTAAITAPAAQQVAAAAAPVAYNAAAWPPELPAGTPKLAFDGYCPVSLQQAQKWVRGDKTFGAIHRDRTYLFAGESQRQKFLASPDSYSPVFSGNDPVKMLDENQQVAGTRKFGCAYRGAFYLFSSKESMARFAKQPDRYSAGVRQAMKRMEDPNSKTMRR